jgi:uncharacterized membrane protein YgcG
MVPSAFADENTSSDIAENTTSTANPLHSDLVLSANSKKAIGTSTDTTDNTIKYSDKTTSTADYTAAEVIKDDAHVLNDTTASKLVELNNKYTGYKVKTQVVVATVGSLPSGETIGNYRSALYNSLGFRRNDVNSKGDFGILLVFSPSTRQYSVQVGSSIKGTLGTELSSDFVASSAKGNLVAGDYNAAVVNSVTALDKKLTDYQSGKLNGESSPSSSTDTSTSSTDTVKDESTPIDWGSVGHGLLTGLKWVGIFVAVLALVFGVIIAIVTSSSKRKHDLAVGKSDEFLSKGFFNDMPIPSDTDKESIRQYVVDKADVDSNESMRTKATDYWVEKVFPDLAKAQPGWSSQIDYKGYLTDHLDDYVNAADDVNLARIVADANKHAAGLFTDKDKDDIVSKVINDPKYSDVGTLAMRNLLNEWMSPLSTRVKDADVKEKADEIAADIRFDEDFKMFSTKHYMALGGDDFDADAFKTVLRKDPKFSGYLRGGMNANWMWDKWRALHATDNK